jgi:hypothetical protein
MRSSRYLHALQKFAVPAAALALGLPVMSATTAYAGPTAPAGFQDCFQANVDPNHLVSSVDNKDTYRTIALRCGTRGWGIVHINDRHGPVNDTAVRCIEHVLSTAKYEGPASGKDNVSYTISSRKMDARVIVNVETDNIVTAYTSEGGSSRSNNWQDCINIPAALQHSPVAPSVQPQSASSCWQDWTFRHSVCIDVRGNKLHVDTLGTSETWQDGVTRCAVPQAVANGRVFRIGNSQCGFAAHAENFEMNNNFPNNLQLCAGWSDTEHLACIKVHD